MICFPSGLFACFALTIENPISGAEFTAAPHDGRHSLRADEVSDVRVAAFESFVKNGENLIVRNTTL